MGKLYDVTAVTGTYEKDGETKKRYQTIGAVFDTKNGQMLKLEAVPIGWDGWAYLNEPQQREQQQKPAARIPQRPGAAADRGHGTQASRPSTGFDDMDDDIPFN